MWYQFMIIFSITFGLIECRLLWFPCPHISGVASWHFVGGGFSAENESDIHQACIQMRVTAFKCKCKCAKRFKCKCKCKCTAFWSNANANASAQHFNQMQMQMHLNQMQMQMQMQTIWWSTHQLVSCNGSANDWHNAYANGQSDNFCSHWSQFTQVVHISTKNYKELVSQLCECRL